MLASPPPPPQPKPDIAVEGSPLLRVDPWFLRFCRQRLPLAIPPSISCRSHRSLLAQGIHRTTPVVFCPSAQHQRNLPPRKLIQLYLGAMVLTASLYLGSSLIILHLYQSIVDGGLYCQRDYCCRDYCCHFILIRGFLRLHAGRCCCQDCCHLTIPTWGFFRLLARTTAARNYYCQQR